MTNYHTPTPWATDGSYVVAKFGPTIADCGKSPSMDRREQRANADFIIKAANNHDALLAALIEIASYDDSLASERLEKSGSYSGFDEPDSVKIAREVIRGVLCPHRGSPHDRL